MVKVSPWHSSRATDPAVYHDNTDCAAAIIIPAEHQKPGTDNRPRCVRCANLA